MKQIKITNAGPPPPDEPETAGPARLPTDQAGFDALEADVVEAAPPVKYRPEPGIYPGLTEREYHDQWDAIHHSGLALMDDSPAHYKTGNKAPSTAAQNQGAAIHCAVLTPDLFNYEYALECSSDRKTEDGQAKRADALWKLGAELRDSIWTGHGDAETARSLITADGALHECSFAWDDLEFDFIRCCGRVDEIIPRFDGLPTLVSLKTTARDAGSEYRRGIYIRQYRAHSQAANYLDGLDALTMAKGHATVRRRHVTILIETGPDRYHGVAVFEMDQDTLEQGRREIRRWYSRLAESIQTDKWPGYSEGIASARLPKYAFDREFAETLDF